MSIVAACIAVSNDIGSDVYRFRAEYRWRRWCMQERSILTRTKIDLPWATPTQGYTPRLVSHYDGFTKNSLTSIADLAILTPLNMYYCKRKIKTFSEWSSLVLAVTQSIDVYCISVVDKTTSPKHLLLDLWYVKRRRDRSLRPSRNFSGTLANKN